jgi:RimJ/RimL family protein N-acetyltransferase
VLTLETERLLYAPTPIAVMRERLLRSDFLADLPLGSSPSHPGGGCLRVRFPEEWPGEDARGVLPIWIARAERSPDPGPWCGGVAVRRQDSLAVASMGFKSPPDATGTVEIGYAVNASVRGLGYATEMATALAAWALDQPGVRRVTAECLETNVASARVLEKSGFRRLGRHRSEDGDVLLWERHPLGTDREPAVAPDGAGVDPGGERSEPG